ncbi:WbuC family cupin fold metalloprotein [Massilia sp. TS11]|uniref:WbuC family cupin fold metalloprotein n=1 Tax=Massilia sp. TS11 TaxID=2908003 RepID=UPI001EDAA116|nr:WbuC family cupin fold metalloprotein [Massilia sp. TS11]MCG2586659.1 WbuC family cupin fold metalloprotein [Massilia sp. TS11]
MKLIQKSPEVYLAPGPVAAIGADEIALLTRAVQDSPRGRVRINLHGDSSDPLHEMFIAIMPGSYIRPHRHPAKSESFHLVHGEVDVVVFHDDGSLREVVRLGAPGSGKPFYYRMSAPLFHTLVIHTPLIVTHETTNGPFDPAATEFAAFAPAAEAEPDQIAAWQQHVRAISGSAA